MIHHDFFNVFQEFEDFLIDEIIRDPAVVRIVEVIRTTEIRAERISAVNQLMGRIE